MRASNCKCRCLYGGIAAITVLAWSADAWAVANVGLRPVRATSGPFVFTPASPNQSDIKIPGGGTTVDMELRVNSWGPLAGGLPKLATVQTGIDADGSFNFRRCSAPGGEDNLCTIDSDCPSTCGTSGTDFCGPCVGTVYNPCLGTLKPRGYPGDPNGREAAGGYQAFSECVGGSNVGGDCSLGQLCPGGACVARTDWVHFGVPYTAASSTFASLNYGYGSTATNALAPGPLDIGQELYFGTLRLVVSPDAVGLFTVKLLNTETFCNDLDGTPTCSGAPSRPAGTVDCNLFNATITIPSGRCCFNLGETPADQCDDTCMSETLCAAQPDNPNNAGWLAGSTLCPAGGGPPCPKCITNADCADPIGAVADNKCTDNLCQASVCSNPLLYNPALDCCDPAVGVPAGLTSLEDDDPCTLNNCDPATGAVTHPPAADGTDCDDAFDCTTPDDCVAGVCVGIDVNTLACTVDGDCPLGTCETVDPTSPTGLRCLCSESTPLCLFAVDKHCSISDEPCQEDDDCGTAGGVCVGEYPDPNCFDPDAAVNMAVHIGAGSQIVTGGQFNIQYDPSCLDFVSIGPCTGSIYTNIIQVDVDEVAGRIFYAVTSDPNTMVNEGSAGPADLACLKFTKVDDCDDCQVCFVEENPRLNILTNDEGNRVPTDNCGCSKPIRLNGDLTLNTPPGANVNADCARTYSDVLWNAPNASDTCDGPLTVVCNAQHVIPSLTDDIQLLILTGGRIPQGKSFFVCTATDSCGDSKTNVWTVTVSDQQTIDVEVDLAGPINNAGPFNRAITFDLYNDCSSEPVTECAVLEFQGPYNLPGHATGSLKVNKGNFLCITAYDCLHTLCASADIQCVNKRWTATWKGDGQLGNGLLGGNLDGCKTDALYADKVAINILDFGVFMAELAAGSIYEPNGDTTCLTVHPHGDINADGLVDQLDYAFILDNYLANCKGECCNTCVNGSNDGQFCTTAQQCPGGQCWSSTGPLAGGPIGQTNEVSVKDLRKMGYGSATVADLNGDGLLNLDDMALYMQGVMPQQNAAPARNLKGRGTR